MAFRSGVVLSRHKYNSCPSILLFAVCSLHPLTDILNLKLSMDEDGQKVAADEEVALAAIMMMMMMMAMAATTKTLTTPTAAAFMVQIEFLLIHCLLLLLIFIVAKIPRIFC